MYDLNKIYEINDISIGYNNKSDCFTLNIANGKETYLNVKYSLTHRQIAELFTSIGELILPDIESPELYDYSNEKD